ncbi:porin [Klebsiella variicola]|uniref:porin n=3 Tax=Klebsiella pneumoniae complex TaxID=3390273 RepID=UPI000D7425BE|nr:porin [Klebsiella variicola]HCB0435375.1 porin [Klebsiella variicola subsp. variicola]PXK21871.1 phosphoporin PhoE [Klebsiella variicola]PXL14424.1 phosphoporin PhoE [Klebsiella variicola]PXL37180.1 phosphoporin PhoE [Klebsiella variicola]PXL63009.1 phosphoporin PhoE [Klebsiella variicola]
MNNYFGKISALGFSLFFSSGIANAAVVYDKDGNKLDFYGKLVAKGKYSFSKGHARKDSGFGSIGFRGQTEITDKIEGYGQWEYRAYTNSYEGNQSTETRIAFSGLKYENLGSIDYGRNYGIVYDVESYTDRAPSHSAMTWGGNYGDNFMTSRAGGVLTYRNNNFFGLSDKINFGVQYQGKNDRSDIKTSNGDGVGYSVGYDFDCGISFIGAYSNSNRTLAQKLDGKGNKAEAWAVGVKYDANSVYLATLFAETRNTTRTGSGGNAGFANKTENFEIIAQYVFDSGLMPSLSYVQTKGKDLTASGSFNGGDADMAKFIEVGVAYYFNKNFKVYADYYINLLNDNSSYVKSVGGMNGSDDVMALNATYYF